MSKNTKINEDTLYRITSKDDKALDKLLDHIISLTINLEIRATHGYKEQSSEERKQALVDCCGRAEALLQLLNLYDDLKNGGTEAYGDWLQDLDDLDPGCVRKYTTLTEIDELELFEPRHPMDYDKIVRSIKN